MSLQSHRYFSIASSQAVSDRFTDAVLELESGAGCDPVRIEALWLEISPERAEEVLSALLKADLRGRFDHGQRPDVFTYLECFDAVRESRERVVSLVYEEYCLLKERGEAVDPEEFCARYQPWRDSLQDQIRCHELLSQAAGSRPRTARLPASGERFRSFRLGQLLGQGGSARVFLAHDDSLGGRRVALKVSTDRGTEAAIQGRLDHAHIVPVLSVTDDAETGLRALCMPYRAGLPLDEIIRRVDPGSGPRRADMFLTALNGVNGGESGDEEETKGWRGFPQQGTYAEGVAWIVAVIADALGHAHSHRVYHRDVKPANVLLTVREGPQLLDFNLAHEPHSADRAQAALRGGTLPYMAPEQLEAFLDPQKWDGVIEAADVYSLGLLLRELLTGQRPEAPDPKLPLPRAIRELLDRRTAEATSPRGNDPLVPPSLQAIIARCLAIRPADRYPEAKGLSDDLKRFEARRRRTRRISRWVFSVVLTLCAGTFACSLLQRLYEHARAPDFAQEAIKHFQTGDLDQALVLANRAIRGNPKYFAGYWARSAIYGKLPVKPAERAGHLEAALRDVNTAIAEATTQAFPLAVNQRIRLYLQKGNVLFVLGRGTEAEQAYNGAIALDPERGETHFVVARIALEDGQFEMALKGLDKAICWGENGLNPANKQTLSGYYTQRAAVNVLVGQEIQKSAGKEGYQTAASFFMKADLDEKTARTLLEEWRDVKNTPIAPEALAEMDRLAASVQIGLGDVASAREDYATSMPCYLAAQVSIEKAIFRSGLVPKTENLLEAVKERIDADRPKFLAAPRSSRPR